MAEHDELIKRLRGPHIRRGWIMDAASVIERIQADNEALRAALEPFVRVASINMKISAGWPDNKPNVDFCPRAWPVWSDFLRAALAHAGGEGK
jgi:hypothetical protein